MTRKIRCSRNSLQRILQTLGNSVSWVMFKEITRNGPESEEHP